MLIERENARTKKQEKRQREKKKKKRERTLRRVIVKDMMIPARDKTIVLVA